MWAVIKKEFKSYFLTPIGYVFIGVFLIAFSISFFFSVLGYGTVNFEYIYYTLPTILVLAFIIPLLTMRSFSEERKSGTEQLLLTSPVSINNKNSTRKIHCSTRDSCNNRTLYINVFCNIMPLWYTKINNNICNIIRIFTICNVIHIIWYVNIKHYRKSNYCRNYINRIFYNNLGNARI